MRILSGLYKGRSLLSPPPGGQTRPVTGLVKKSLFGMLGEALDGAAVVDLFCGTGTMGLEALSRGARACWFGERDRRVLERLRRNIEALAVGGCCTVWPGDVTAGLDRRLGAMGAAVDVVFVDPPYETARRWSWQVAADTIFTPLGGHLAAGGVVVLRLPGEIELPRTLGPLGVMRLRRYGDMALALLGGAAANQEHG